MHGVVHGVIEVVKQPQEAIEPVSTEGPPRNGEPYLIRDRFLFDPKSGRFFTITEQGAWIYRAFRDGKRRREIETELAAHYGVDPGCARRDVEFFASNLIRLGLLDTEKAA